MNVVKTEIDPSEAYRHFRDKEMDSYLQIEEISQGGMSNFVIEQMEMPEYKLNRLQKELDELEEELKMLEKEDIQSFYFGLESESELQLLEVEFLRDQLLNVTESEAFK